MVKVGSSGCSYPLFPFVMVDPSQGTPGIEPGPLGSHTSTIWATRSKSIRKFRTYNMDVCLKSP